MRCEDAFNLTAEDRRHVSQCIVPACGARFRIASTWNSGIDLTNLAKSPPERLCAKSGGQLMSSEPSEALVL
jgi:hypothetical protein